MFHNMVIRVELIANCVHTTAAQLFFFLPLLCMLHKMCLARPREQKGSTVSDYVVSHGSKCLETLG